MQQSPSEGEIYYENAVCILKEIDDMEQLVASSRSSPKGLLRVNAPFGFGRKYIAPAISSFIKKFPEIEVQLHLTDRPVHLPSDTIDVSIHFGQIPDSRLIAKRIAANKRLLCASPFYLNAAGTPLNPRDLSTHQCIVLKQNDGAYANWRFSKGNKEETVKVHGKLSSNDGQVTLDWALDGHGILMRAEWDVLKYLKSGRLIQILKEYETPPADIYAVYADRLEHSPRVAHFLEHLKDYLKDYINSQM